MNKTISFDGFLEKLNDCTAVMVDGESLCFPSFDDPDFDFIIDTDYGTEYFREGTNRIVSVENNVATLINTDGNKATFVLLSPVVL